MIYLLRTSKRLASAAHLYCRGALVGRLWWAWSDDDMRGPVESFTAWLARHGGLLGELQLELPTHAYDDWQAADAAADAAASSGHGAGRRRCRRCRRQPQPAQAYPTIALLRQLPGSLASLAVGELDANAEISTQQAGVLAAALGARLTQLRRLTLPRATALAAEAVVPAALSRLSQLTSLRVT